MGPSCLRTPPTMTRHSLTQGSPSARRQGWQSQLKRPWAQTVQSPTVGSEGAPPPQYKVSDRTWKEQEQSR